MAKGHTSKFMSKKIIILVCILICTQFIVLAQIQNPRNVVYDWNTDTTKHTIDLTELILVAPKGLFPIIDYPKFNEKQVGLQNFFKYEPVISVEINSMAKAYPLNMLTFHEMSNDTLAGVPILPTYCPLCNSGIVYDRRLNLRFQVFFEIVIWLCMTVKHNPGGSS